MNLDRALIRTSTLLLCTCLLLTPARSRADQPDDAALAAFMRTNFESMARLADLPAGVRRALDIDTYPMADAGGDWNPGCIVDWRPGRRFIFAGKSPDLWFVYFEKGGRTNYQVVVTVRQDQAGRLSEEGSWILKHIAKTITDLKTAVQASARDHQAP